MSSQIDVPKLIGKLTEEAKTVAILNDYIRQLHAVLNQKPLSSNEEAIPIKRLMEILTKDEVLQTDDFIIIPKRLIKEDMPPRVDTNVQVQSLKPPRKSKSKMTCSHCQQIGHKRSQCPQILYKEI